MTQLFVGYEKKTARQVFIPIFFMLVTGQTRLSGKTTTLKALAKQVIKKGYKVLVLDTKRQIQDYEGFGKDVPVCLRQTTDALILLGLLESVMKRKLSKLYPTLTEISEGTETFEQVIENALQLREKVRSGWKKDACTHLIDLLRRLIEQTRKVETTTELKLPYMINRMSINDFEIEGQQLIAKTVFDEALVNHQKLIIILDEAYKFCLSEDTEVLTKEGWKPFPEIQKSDIVLTYNRKNNLLEYNPITDIIIRYNNPALHQIKSKTIDILATNNHRHVIEKHIRTRKNGKYIHYWKGKTVIANIADFPRQFRIPAAGRFNGVNGNHSDAFIQVLGWVITDGFVSNKYKDKPYIIRISQIKTHNVKKIKELISKADLPFSICTRTRTNNICNSKKVYTATETVFTFPKKSSRKIIDALDGKIHRIPRWIFQTSFEQRLKFFNTLIAGDGTFQRRNKNSPSPIIFYTHTKELADDVQELCITLNYRAIIGYCREMWRVYISRRYPFHHIYRDTNIKKLPYSGKVYDLTVPNGTFIARRLGKPFITGNCPQKYSSACKKSIQDFVTQAGATECFLWIGTQFLATTDKAAMKTMAIKLLGTQDHDTECEHTLDLIPQIKGRYNKDSIMGLGLGHFIVVTKQWVKTIYAVPEYADKSECMEVALGRRKPKDIHYLFSLSGEEIKELKKAKKPKVKPVKPAEIESVAKLEPKPVEPVKPVESKPTKPPETEKKPPEPTKKPKRRKPSYRKQLPTHERLELLENNLDALRHRIVKLEKTPPAQNVDLGKTTTTVNIYKAVKHVQVTDETVKGKILTLAKEGFFKGWHPLRDVVKELQNRKWTVKKREVQSELVKMGNEGLLGMRKKNRENCYSLSPNVIFED